MIVSPPCPMFEGAALVNSGCISGLNRCHRALRPIRLCEAPAGLSLSSQRVRLMLFTSTQGIPSSSSSTTSTPPPYPSHTHISNHIHTTPTSTLPPTTHPIFKSEPTVLIDLMFVAARNFTVDGRFGSDGGSGSLFSSIHNVSCGSLVVALDVARLFANHWAALLETKGRLQIGRLLQTSVFVASSTRRDEALEQFRQNEFAWHRSTRDIADATVRREVKAWRRRLTCKCPEDCCQC